MLEIGLLIVGAAVIASIRQHFRYQRIRHDAAQDRQHALHPSQAFHVIVFFKLRAGTKVIETARQFTQQLLSFNNAQLIYAGQAAFTENAQLLDDRHWDGVLLFEYPSRQDYELSRVNPRTLLIRQLFADSYFHGMRRNRKAGLLLPQLLLRHRLKDLLRGKWRVEALQRSAAFETASELQVWRNRISRLHALHEVNRSGLVVYSLVKYGKGGPHQAHHMYSRELVSRMAALSYGPLHTGHSIALEEFARFDRVYALYYPSARYFAQLINSQYFHAVVGNLVPKNCVRVATVPITDRL